MDINYLLYLIIFFSFIFNSIIVQLKYTILTRKAVNVNTSAQFIFFNVDPVGLEPTTYGLWGRCCWPTELRVLIKSKPLKSTLKQVLKLLVCYDVRSPCDYIVDYYYIQWCSLNHFFPIVEFIPLLTFNYSTQLTSCRLCWLHNHCWRNC